MFLSTVYISLLTRFCKAFVLKRILFFVPQYSSCKIRLHFYSASRLQESAGTKVSNCPNVTKDYLFNALINSLLIVSTPGKPTEWNV